MILLHDLLAAGGTLVGEAHTQRFTDFSYDSRLTNPGELFLAIRTARADGHDYIPAALEAGATGVICSWVPPNAEGMTVILTDNPEGLIQQWAARRLQQVHPTVIAVTGSVGKTSTRNAIATLLATHKPTFSSRQSFNSLLGLPIALARLEDEHRFAVLEFGSDHFGEIAQLAALFPPHIAVVTSVSNAHLKSFGSLEGVAQEKGSLVEALPDDGWAILNGDDRHVAAMRERTAAQVLTFGQHPHCDFQASSICFSIQETTFSLHWGGKKPFARTSSEMPNLGEKWRRWGIALRRFIGCRVSRKLRLQPTRPLSRLRNPTATTRQATISIPGEPAIPIALAAVGAALVCGMSLEQATDALPQVQCVAGRMCPLPTVCGATLLDDTFNATPTAVLAALRSLAALPARRRIVVLGHLADLDEAEAQATYHEISVLAGSVADVLICKGDWGNGAVQMARQVQPSLKTRVVYTAAGAIQALPPDMGPDDLILVKGSAEARMERIVSGLLAPSLEAAQVLVRQEPAWRSVRIGTPDRPTWAAIDLDALAHNVRRLREIAGVPLMAVVKADAYGHGAVRVARAALASEASMLAVATLSEACTLREADITAPILVLGYTPPWQAHEALRLNVTCAVFDLDVAQAISDAAAMGQREAAIHLKVDTGMGRLGIPPEQAVPLLRKLARLPWLRVEGIYSHFATADSNEETFARTQLQRFQDVVREITSVGLRPPLVHMANSAALLRFPEARFDMVRPGIACYGLSPSNETLLPPDFQTVLSFHTSVAQVKPLPPGVSLSYGGIFVTQRPSRIATLPVGYADGFRRSPPWREVLVRGRRAPVVGRVCMDYAMIDVTDIEKVKRGDPVTLIGSQGKESITTDDVAGWLGTINYEVVAALLPRVPREVDQRSG
jgi:Alr-MurF fusion protein